MQFLLNTETLFRPVSVHEQRMKGLKLSTRVLHLALTNPRGIRSWCCLESNRHNVTSSPGRAGLYRAGSPLLRKGPRSLTYVVSFFGPFPAGPSSRTQSRRHFRWFLDRRGQWPTARSATSANTYNNLVWFLYSPTGKHSLWSLWKRDSGQFSSKMADIDAENEICAQFRIEFVIYTCFVDFFTVNHEWVYYDLNFLSRESMRTECTGIAEWRNDILIVRSIIRSLL